MGEFLRRTLEAQGKTVPAPDATPSHTPTAPARQSEVIEKRLKDLQDQIAIGGITMEDRRMIASLEAELALSTSRETPAAAEPKTGLAPSAPRIGRQVFVGVRALLTGDF